MSPAPQQEPSGPIRFGAFEIDPRTGLLRKHGVRIRLQEQPFRVLLALLERPGEPVAREELQRRIWPDSEFGDFDHSLNIAVNKIRQALSDSADSPRYIETLPRRGYRFIAAVEAPAPQYPVVVETFVVPPKPRPSRWVFVAGITAVALALVVAALVFFAPAGRPQALSLRRLTNDSLPKYSLVSDGARFYFETFVWDPVVYQVPLSGGEPVRLPVTLPGDSRHVLLDLTPDRQELLLAVSEKDASPYAAAPLWTKRILDGSNRRMGTLAAREARFSPNGRWLAFTVGGYQGEPGALWVATSDGANPRRLLELSGKAVTSPSWSPDGNRIAYAELNRATQDTATWEVLPDGTGRRRLLPDWPERHAPAGWAADGRLLLVAGNGQLWTAQPGAFFGSKLRPVQLTSGDVRFSSILASPSGATLYGVGTTPLGQLQRFDTHSRTWEPHLGGVSADSAEYSPDRRSVVYATHPEGELWIRQADGSHPVQLTKAPMQAGIGRWSPDGRTIAFPAKSTPAEPWSIYLVNAAGGSLRPACPKECRALDVAWMPDGKKIVFSPPVNRYFTEPPFLRVLDIDTGEVTKFPDSDGLVSPRLSPDRSRLLALAFGRENDRIRIYRFSDGAWSKSTSPGPGVPDWPAWSRDGESVWYYNVIRSEIRRHRLLNDRDELVLPLKVTEMTGLIGYWFNLTQDDEPMILRRRDIQEIYAPRLDGPLSPAHRKSAEPGVPDSPDWSRVSESIWYYDALRSEIRRHRLRDDRDELVLPLKVTETTGLVGYWFNLTPDDEPMILRRRDIQEIYALDWMTR